MVLVVGDFLAGGLAEGLSTAFAENPHVRVVDRTNGSSGLARDDFYDWPARIGELIDAEKPAAVVVMLGANDRQQMQRRRQPANRCAPKTGSRTILSAHQAMAKAVAQQEGAVSSGSACRHSNRRR